MHHPLRTLSPFLLGLVLPTVAHAQFDARIEIRQSVVESTNVVTGASDRRTLPPGTDVTAGLDLLASVDSGRAQARLQSNLIAAGQRLQWEVRGRVDDTDFARVPPIHRVVSGRNDLRMRLAWRGQAPLVGRLRVWITVLGGSSWHPGFVDVGADGTAEATLFGSWEQNVALDSTPLLIDITHSEVTDPSPYDRGSAEFVGHVTFEPLNIRSVGSECGGKMFIRNLRADGTGALFDLQARPQQGFATWGVLYSGATQAAYPLPGTGCLIDLSPTSYVYLPISSTGIARYDALRVPNAVTNLLLDFIWEDASVAGTQWYSTNGLQIWTW